MISNGDHIYWDQKTLLNKPFAKFVTEKVWPDYGGALALSVPMLHPRNPISLLASRTTSLPLCGSIETKGISTSEFSAAIARAIFTAAAHAERTFLIVCCLAPLRRNSRSASTKLSIGSASTKHSL